MSIGKRQNLRQYDSKGSMAAFANKGKWEMKGK